MLLYRVLLYRLHLYRVLLYRLLVYRVLLYQVLVYRVLMYRVLLYRVLLYRLLLYRVLLYIMLLYRVLLYSWAVRTVDIPCQQPCVSVSSLVSVSGALCQQDIFTPRPFCQLGLLTSPGLTVVSWHFALAAGE